MESIFLKTGGRRESEREEGRKKGKRGLWSDEDCEGDESKGKP
jgi:hypothetical protein